jgi:predicted glutamine amidotransferase
MCQLLAMNCNVPTDICFSFAGFQARGGATDVHADGWGIAFLKVVARASSSTRNRRAFRRSPNSCAATRSIRRTSLRTSARRPRGGRAREHPSLHARTVGTLLDFRP